MSLATLASSAGKSAAANDVRSGLAAGTPVLTLSGPVAVERLASGDRIVTRDGVRRLVGVQRVDAAVRLVRVSESAIGVDQPEADMLMTADMQILIRDWRAKALRGCDQAVIAADRLIDGEYIRREPEARAVLFRLEFDSPVVIYVGGLELALTPTPVSA